MEGAVDHEESGLEADKLGEGEGLWQESDNGYQLKHALRLALFPQLVLDLDRL